MQSTRFAALFLGSFLMSLPVVAQQPTQAAPAPRDAQTVLLLQRSLAALTGTTPVNDVTLSGTVTRIAGSDNDSGTATLKATTVGQARIDLNLPSGQRSEVRDTSANPLAGSWSGPDGNWHPIAGHNLRTDPTWFFPEFLIHRVLSNPAFSISPVDAEIMDGIEVQHFVVIQQIDGSGQLPASIQGLLRGLTRIDIYLNSSSLLPTAIAFNDHPDVDAGLNIPIEIKFLNYQRFSGVTIPYHVQRYLNNELVLDLTVQTIQINSNLPSTDFQVQ